MSGRLENKTGKRFLSALAWLLFTLVSVCLSVCLSVYRDASHIAAQSACVIFRVLSQNVKYLNVK